MNVKHTEYPQNSRNKLAFLKFMQGYVYVSNDDWHVIASRLTHRTANAGEIILQQGEICRHLYFLESGLLRYFLLKDGAEITKFFTESPYLFTSQVSFSNLKPAGESIQALEECQMLTITHKDSYELLELKSWSDFVRKLVQEVQHFTEELLVEAQTVRAEDRYRKMIIDNPELVQRVPLKYIASYLGIKPQSLSRIRKELSFRDRS